MILNDNDRKISLFSIKLNRAERVKNSISPMLAHRETRSSLLLHGINYSSKKLYDKGLRISQFQGTNSLSCVYIGDVQHDIAHDKARDIAPYLVTLANRNDPICVASPKVAKASKMSVATIANVFSKKLLPMSGNTEGGSIIVQLTSCLTGLESDV